MYKNENVSIFTFWLEFILFTRESIWATWGNGGKYKQLTLEPLQWGPIPDQLTQTLENLCFQKGPQGILMGI